MTEFTDDWHVLYVKSQHEKKIAILLKEMKINSFLPCITTIKHWSDRKKKISKPLFPSYVFVNTSSQIDFYKALSVNGVFKYLRFGENYAIVKNDEIYKIKQLLNLEGVSDISTTTSFLNVGEKMKINSGALNGLTCEVIRVSKKRDKIFVRMNSIRQNISATIPSSYLTKI